MSLSSGIRASCSERSNKAPSTYRLLLVDPGIKPGSCSAGKPGKAHISCISPSHPAPVLPPAAAGTHVDSTLLSSHNPCIFYIFSYYTVIQIKLTRKSVTNEGALRFFQSRVVPLTSGFCKSILRDTFQRSLTNLYNIYIRCVFVRESNKKDFSQFWDQSDE